LSCIRINANFVYLICYSVATLYTILFGIYFRKIVEIFSVASETISARKFPKQIRNNLYLSMYLFNLANGLFLTLLQDEFPVFQFYTYEEIRDMHIMYICTEMNSQWARFLYHRIFPSRCLPNQELFTLLHNHFVRFVFFRRYEDAEPSFPLADLFNRQTKPLFEKRLYD